MIDNCYLNMKRWTDNIYSIVFRCFFGVLDVGGGVWGGG